MRNVLTIIALMFSLAASGLSHAVDPADLGLTQVKDTRTGVAYLKADQDYSHYDKIAIVELDTSSVEVNEPRANRAHRNDWEMDEERQARVKAMHFKAFSREFIESQEFELVDTIDENTLVLVTRLSEVSPTLGYDSQDVSGRVDVYSKGAGSAVIEMWLVDGETGEVVAAVASSRQLGHFARLNNSVTNHSDVQMGFNSWARQAREAIDNLQELAAEAG